MKNFAMLLLLTSLGLTGAFASDNDGDSAISLGQSGELYLPSDDPSADLSEALARASASNKRVLVVMGANWCHDSRGKQHHAGLPGIPGIFVVNWHSKSNPDTSNNVINGQFWSICGIFCDSFE